MHGKKYEHWQDNNNNRMRDALSQFCFEMGLSTEKETYEAWTYVLHTSFMWYMVKV